MKQDIAYIYIHTFLNFTHDKLYQQDGTVRTLISTELCYGDYEQLKMTI